MESLSSGALFCVCSVPTPRDAHLRDVPEVNAHLPKYIEAMPRTLLMLEWKVWTDFSQFTLNESPFYQACSHISYTLNFPCQMSLSYVFTTNQLPLGQAHSQVTDHVFAHREQFSPSICSSLTIHTQGWLPQVNQQAKQILGPKTTRCHSYHSSAWLWREETLNKKHLGSTLAPFL